MTAPIDYDQMREMTHNLLAKGVNAVETNAIFQGKFGTENSPTLCTIYKWRRELRGGMREANDRIVGENEAEDGQPKGAKTYKKDCDKYCVQCNREMSSRHYYELHMLKIHNVFVGDSKALHEILESFGPRREKQIIFRCDECFGGELDYELLEDLRRHRLLEHGRKMREKADSAKTKYFESPSPSSFALSSPRGSTPKIRRCRSTVPFVYSPTKNKDEDILADGEESIKTLRRSARVPKPSPALLQSLLNAKEIAKEFANFEENVHEENDDNEAEPIMTIMRDGRIEVEEQDQNKRAKKQIESAEEREETQPKKSDGGKKRMTSPDALDAADSMLSLAIEEKRQNAKLGKRRDESLGEEPKADSAEALQVEKKRLKSFSIARPNRHDDCTWFGHSVAASLRQMPIQTKELAKSRIQQVIYECTASNIRTNDVGTREKAKKGAAAQQKKDGMDKESVNNTVLNNAI